MGNGVRSWAGLGVGLGFRVFRTGFFLLSFSTWTPEVCKIIAFWAIFRGFEPLFYLLWGVQVLACCSCEGLGSWVCRKLKAPLR